MKTKQVKKGKKTMKTMTSTKVKAVNLGAGRNGKVAAKERTERKKGKGEQKVTKGDTKAVAAEMEGGLALKRWHMEVELGRLSPSPTNRKHFSEEGLEEIAASIRKAGIDHALTVRVCPAWILGEIKRLKKAEAHGLSTQEKIDLVALELLAGQRTLLALEEDADAVAGLMMDPKTRFEIVCGERRWRGAQRAGLKTAPVVARVLNDRQAQVVQVVENLQRENVQALEEGEKWAGMVASGKWTAVSLGEEFGIPKTKVYERLKLGRLTGPVREALEKGEISPSLAAAIATVPGAEAQAEILKEVALDYNGDARPVREVLDEIEEHYMRPLKGVGWELKDEFVYEGCVSAACGNCPRMTRNMTEENPDLARGPARCLGLVCFEKRKKIYLDAELVKAKQQGLEVRGKLPSYGNGELFIEGQKTGIGSEYQDPAPLMDKAKVPAKAVGVMDGKVVRVWTRAELEAAGVLKDQTERREANRKEQAKRERDDALLEAMKAEALHRVLTHLRGEALNVDPTAAELALLRQRHYYRLPWDQKEKVSPESFERGALFEAMAKDCVEQWYNAGEPPFVLGALGIRVDLLKDVAKERLAEEKAAKEEGK